MTLNIITALTIKNKKKLPINLWFYNILRHLYSSSIHGESTHTFTLLYFISFPFRDPNTGIFWEPVNTKIYSDYRSDAIPYRPPFCFLLCCTDLFCLILSYPTLSCTILSCLVLFCPVLSCPVLSRSVLSCLVLPCPALPCPVLYCTVLCCPVLSYPVVLSSYLFSSLNSTVNIKLDANNYHLFQHNCYKNTPRYFLTCCTWNVLSVYGSQMYYWPIYFQAFLPFSSTFA